MLTIAIASSASVAGTFAGCGEGVLDRDSLFDMTDVLSHSGAVGPQGGVVALEEGTLTLPEGALTQETTITLRRVRDDKVGPVGPVFRLVVPAGVLRGDTPAKPTFTLRFTPERGVSPSQIVLAWWGRHNMQTRESWEPLSDARYAAGSVSAPALSGDMLRAQEMLNLMATGLTVAPVLYCSSGSTCPGKTCENNVCQSRVAP